VRISAYDVIMRMNAMKRELSHGAMAPWRGDAAI
jgi:hypothetical protein